MTALPHVSPLFRDYVLGPGAPESGKLQPFYSPLYRENRWMQHPPVMDPERRQAITQLLRLQNRDFGAGAATEANLDRLAAGAAAVVTGQQVGLFGGPLLTLCKAASAVRLAAEATQNGHPHVPVFWMASEDHDFDEVNQATFLTGHDLHTLNLPGNPAPGKPVGDIPLGQDILPLIQDLHQYLDEKPIAALLASLYTPAATFASAFAAFLTRTFSHHGLIVIDASPRPFHALAAATLRAAIEHADEIHSALIERSQELERAGYHSQVMVGGASSLLFLIDEMTGVRTALKKSPQSTWSAGGRQYNTDELLAILDASPERISPNVLLRPVMQDTLLPTSAYIGGPSEIAYFAQSQVVYEHILNRTTPVLPRFSATLVEQHLTKLLELHHLSLTDVFTPGEALAQHLGASATSDEGKHKLSAAESTLDRELKALTAWMHIQDPGLGHAADVAASKMQYQMNRLRRLSSAFTLQREQSLRRHADALCHELFPGGNLQERVLSSAWALSRFGPSLIDVLVEHARSGHCAHQALQL